MLFTRFTALGWYHSGSIFTCRAPSRNGSMRGHMLTPFASMSEESEYKTMWHTPIINYLSIWHNALLNHNDRAITGLWLLVTNQGRSWGALAVKLVKLDSYNNITLCYFAQTQPLSTLFNSPCHSYSSHFNSAHTQLYINSDTAQDVLLLLIFFLNSSHFMNLLFVVFF